MPTFVKWPKKVRLFHGAFCRYSIIVLHSFGKAKTFRGGTDYRLMLDIGTNFLYSRNMTKERLDIKVTKINNKWHARLYNLNTGQILDESACKLKSDIGWICREMLRWYDKLGGISKFASAARNRQKGKPEGKVYYHLLNEN